MKARYLLVGLFVLTSCQERGPASLLHCAPADTPAALWMPDAAQSLDQLDAFANRATRKVGAAAVKRLRQALVNQLGADPLDKDTYLQAGVDASAGLLIFLEQADSEPVLALAVKDRSRFDNTLTAQLKQSGIADTVSNSTHQGRTVRTAGRPFGNEVAPTVHWAHVGHYVLLVRADGLPMLDKALARLGANAKAVALADDAVFNATKPRVPAGNLLLFVRSTAASPPAASATAPGLMVPAATTPIVTSVTFNAAGLQTDTFVALPVAGLTAAMGAEPTLALAGRLDADAVAVLLSRAARTDAVTAIRTYPAAAPLLDRLLQPLDQALGAHVETELLPLLSGPLAVGVYLANVAELPQKLKEARSLQTALDFVHVVVTAELTKPEAMISFLERSRLDLERRGIALRKRADKVGNKSITIIEPARDDAKLGWTVYDKHYVYGAGAGRLRKALERLRQGDSELPKLLQQGGVGGALAQVPGSVVVLRAGILADAATAFTSGSDPSTRFGLGALLGSAIELVRTLGDMALSLSATQDGLSLRLRETLQ